MVAADAVVVTEGATGGDDGVGDSDFDLLPLFQLLALGLAGEERAVKGGAIAVGVREMSHH